MARDHLYAKFQRLSADQKAELALAMLVDKGLITPADLREALKTVMECYVCNNYSTPPSETSEQAERLMMDHMRDHHPESVGRVSQQFVNREEDL